MTHSKTSEGNTSGAEDSVVAGSRMSAEEFLSLFEQTDVHASPPGPMQSAASDEGTLAPACPQDGKDKSQS